MLPAVREPRKALDVINGLDQLPPLSVGGDGQLRLCFYPPRPGCLFNCQCGQLPSEPSVTDAKQQPW